MASDADRRQKPVLLDLEKRSPVRQAWLNQTGEILAVVWKNGSQPAEHRSVITAVADASGLSMEALGVRDRNAALKEFRSGAGWHRGADVDRLSGREAQVISNRLLRRAAIKVPTLQTKQQTVLPALTDAIRRQLVGACAAPEECREALLAAAGPHLDTAELAALSTAIARGFAPVGDEP